jgi:hypothetical protein
MDGWWLDRLGQLYSLHVGLSSRLLKTILALCGYISEIIPEIFSFSLLTYYKIVLRAAAIK